MEFEPAGSQLLLELLLREIHAYIVPVGALYIKGNTIAHTAAYRARKRAIAQRAPKMYPKPPSTRIS